MKFSIKELVNYILFSAKTGGLRPLARYILFDDELKTRPTFNWITHKKNGRIKRKFHDVLHAGAISNFADRQIQVLKIIRKNKETEIDNLNKRQPSHPHDLQDLLDIIKRNSLSNCVIISFSHDNFKKVSGGIQLCVDKELHEFNSRNWDYLHIYPTTPITMLAAHGEDVSVGASINGSELPPTTMSQLIKVVKRFCEEEYQLAFVVHHLMGHSPELISDMFVEFSQYPTYIWVHDYFSLCRSYTLMRNGITFCNAPHTSSNACMTCVYGGDRSEHLLRTTKLFSAANAKFIFPSAIAREFSDKFFSQFAANNSVILPHIELKEITTQNGLPVDQPDVISVAFIGTPAHLKGWTVFRSIAERHRTESRYKFLVFSARPPVPGDYEWIPVHTTAAAPNAMIDALEKNQVDIVIIWPGWAETFSFTACEALAGGAYVVTNSWSGNIVRLVEKYGRGTILNSCSELEQFLTSDAALDAVKCIREIRNERRFLVSRSKLTSEVMGI